MLSDFNISSPTANQVFSYNNLTSKWINSTVVLGLSQLTDCNVSGVTDGQMLQYSASSSKWIPYTQTALINSNEAGTLTQMYSTFGGGVFGSGIA